MPHINYFRGETRRKVLRARYPKWWNKVPNNRRFRGKERAAMQRLKNIIQETPTIDEDHYDNEVVFPVKLHHGDDVWNYD